MEDPAQISRDCPPIRFLLTPAEAAQALAISERYLWELTNRGEIPSRRIGRLVRYSTLALLRWVEEQ